MEYSSLKSFKEDFAVHGKSAYDFPRVRAIGKSASGKLYLRSGGFSWSGNSGGYKEFFHPISQEQYDKFATCWNEGEPSAHSVFDLEIWPEPAVTP